MEKIEFNYPEAKRLITKRAHVGVVGSGDMEVLLEPNSEKGARCLHHDQRQRLRRCVEGGLRSFLSRSSMERSVSTLTMPAQTPGSVLLRLEQASGGD